MQEAVMVRVKVGRVGCDVLWWGGVDCGGVGGIG